MNGAAVLAFLAWLTALVVMGHVDAANQKLDRLERELHALCTHGESSIGPATLRNGRITSGASRGVRTGCAP